LNKCLKSVEGISAEEAKKMVEKGFAKCVKDVQ